MRLSLISKISAKILLVLFIAIMSFSSPAYCDPSSKKDDDLLSTILHMEGLLMRPCDKVEQLMSDLIAYGNGYQVIEVDRASRYSECTKTYIKHVSDFIFVRDESGTVMPGKFIKRFLDLKKMAEDGGVLAEGPRPDMGLIDLAHSKNASKYFYFVEDSSEANKRRELRYKLEEEYEKLIDDWNKARTEFYKLFDDKGELINCNKEIEEKKKDGKELERKYKNLSSELTDLALSGDYEHCLGVIKKGQLYTISRMDFGSDGILGPFYIEGEKNTPGGLPGMGYRFLNQKAYEPITKPEIGDFPLALHLKFNGTDYFKFERDMLEAKIKGEEEETRILGSFLGEVCNTCLLAAGCPIGLLYDNSDKLGEFAFKTIYKVTESLAGPGLLLKYVVEHPVDSAAKAAHFLKYFTPVANFVLLTTDEEARKTVENVATPVLKVMFDPRTQAELLVRWDGYSKQKIKDTAESIAEIAKDLNPITWNRFDPQPNETLEQQIERLKAQLDSTEKVKRGIDGASTITALIAEYVLMEKGLGKLDDMLTAYKQEAKLKGLLAKADSLTDAKKVADKVDDVKRVADKVDDAKKVAGKIDDVVPDNKKALEKLLKEQSDNSKKFSEFLTGEKQQLEKGVKLPDDVGKKIGVVDAKGQPVQLRAGEQLGKPGGFNTALVDADNSNLVIRKTNEPMSWQRLEAMDAHDKFGRSVLEKEFGAGSSIRVAKMEGEFYEQTAEGIVRYQKVERVSETALDQVTRQGGKLTPGQQLAIEQAHRDLNNAGYVWMDNTPKNYSFEKLPGGTDRYRLVVIDPDGIYPIKTGDANAAKALQEAVNNTPKKIVEMGADSPHSRLYAFASEYDKAANAYKVSASDPTDLIDWTKLKNANPNIVSAEDITKLHWANAAERLPVSGEIKMLSDKQLIQTVDNYSYKQLLNDPGYKELMAKQSGLSKEIDAMVSKVESEMVQAEKAIKAGPKPSVVPPDKPSAINKEMESTMAILAQQVSAKMSAESCATIRKQVLSGIKDDLLLSAMQECIMREAKEEKK
ncbi:MAG: hypothetical protein KBH82_03530 [Syntrophorhabdaceae bacterium]|nr:hypothetical protein [Syntrophorhabdaceae bacterium]OQB74158.1 MAG: hypothetical protein BWX92_03118 [Deltaproteobacteria bacterium ADurb.Bin135]